MKTKIKPSGETVFIFSDDEDNVKRAFENTLLMGSADLESLIKAAIAAHAELLRQKIGAWDAVTELIKEIYPSLEEDDSFEYNHISGEFRIKPRVLSPS